MAWEWVGATATGVVGVVGITTTGMSARGARKHAAALAKEQIEHSTKAADEARTQDRRAEAYVRCLETVEQVGHWSQSLAPPLDTYPPAPLPPLPELREQIASNARLLAFGSPEVQGLWREWYTAIDEMRHSVHTMAVADASVRRTGKTSIDDMGTWVTLRNELRPREVACRNALADRINTELSGTAT
jgi:hypothetical protein